MQVEITEDTIFVKTPEVDNYIVLHDFKKETKLRINGYKKMKSVPSTDIICAYIKNKICVQFVNTQVLSDYMTFYRQNNDIIMGKVIDLPM